MKADPQLAWLFRPRTLVLLFCAFALVVYLAFEEGHSSVTNAKIGLLAASGVFLLFCMLQFDDDKYFWRPHPAFWRVIKGLSILYLFFLIFLLFQNPDDARHLFSYLDPKLGQPLPEKNYATDCRVFTPENNISQYYNIYHTFYDEFVPGHLLGWFSKTLIFRDVYFVWFLSILFELLEYSLGHVLHNFQECWWDHWIMDVATCNAIGIWFGLKALQYFEAKEYHWVGLSDIPTTTGKIRRAFAQFTPVSWTPFHWAILSSPRRWFGFLGIILMWAAIELNCFFLKYVLWHPPPHPVVIGRLFLWGFIALVSVCQYYHFVDDENAEKVGPMTWLSIAILGTETLICIKFGKGQFPHFTGHPPIIVWIWGLVLVGLVLFTIFYFYVFKCHLQKQDLQEIKARVTVPRRERWEEHNQKQTTKQKQK